MGTRQLIMICHWVTKWYPIFLSEVNAEVDKITGSYKTYNGYDLGLLYFYHLTKGKIRSLLRTLFLPSSLPRWP